MEFPVRLHLPEIEDNVKTGCLELFHLVMFSKLISNSSSKYIACIVVNVQFLCFSLPICSIKIFKDMIKIGFKPKFITLFITF